MDKLKAEIEKSKALFLNAKKEKLDSKTVKDINPQGMKNNIISHVSLSSSKLVEHHVEHDNDDDKQSGFDLSSSSSKKREAESESDSHSSSSDTSDDDSKKEKKRKKKERKLKKQKIKQDWEDEVEDEEKMKEESAEGRAIVWIKKIIRDWKEELATRSEEEAKSGKGMLQTNHFNECRSDIKLLVKLLRKNQINKSVLENVDKAIDLVRQREYVKIAIGKARWPIGVTMVGIHARAGRERIESGNVAHLMNSEKERRFVTAFKRLITYAQSRYPSDEPSKMLGMM